VDRFDEFAPKDGIFWARGRAQADEFADKVIKTEMIMIRKFSGICWGLWLLC